MLSIGEFLELYPELDQYDRRIKELAYECYIEDMDFDIDEFIKSIS
jgi:hypothetical protein